MLRMSIYWEEERRRRRRNIRITTKEEEKRTSSNEILYRTNVLNLSAKRFLRSSGYFPFMSSAKKDWTKAIGPALTSTIFSLKGPNIPRNIK
jgi:hypothetical protein